MFSPIDDTELREVTLSCPDEGLIINGLSVEAVSLGTYTVTASALQDEGEVYTDFTVNVVVPAQEISLDAYEASLYAGETLQLLPQVSPAGAYDMIEINGRKAIDASSFHYIDQTPVNPWQAILALPGGFSKQVAIIAMITIIAGAMGIINKTKCIDASIGKLVSAYKDRLVLLIPILLGIFSVLGAMGINTPIIAFVPMALMLAKSMGADAFTGVALVLMGEISGQAGGAFCTSSTAVAQNLVGLEIFSGWPLRIAATVVLWAAGSFFLVRYVHKLRKQSPLPASDAAELEAPQSEELTTRRLIALIAFIIGFVVLVYGATHGWSTADAIPAVFMVTAVVCGLICGFKPSEIATEFVNGAKTMAGAWRSYSPAAPPSSPPSACTSAT